MSANRKLQTEIQQVLKKVEEGVLLFDDIWEKVYAAEQQSLKEKYEADLKKEIKKLQRLRDQIKSWLSSNEIKDKSQLIELRKIIETKMEQFKVCEKDTKTKAYSKEGLARELRLDPREAEKEEKRVWVNDCLDRLNDVVNLIEIEIERISGGRMKAKSKEQIEKLENRIKKNKWHIARLEQIIKLIENDDLEPSRLDGIKDDVDYYVETANDDDGALGVDDEFDIYEELQLDAIPIVSAADKALLEAAALAALESPHVDGAADPTASVTSIAIITVPSNAEQSPSSPTVVDANPTGSSIEQSEGEVDSNKSNLPKKTAVIPASVNPPPVKIPTPTPALKPSKPIASIVPSIIPAITTANTTTTTAAITSSNTAPSVSVSASSSAAIAVHKIESISANSSNSNATASKAEASKSLQIQPQSLSSGSKQVVVNSETEGANTWASLASTQKPAAAAALPVKLVATMAAAIPPIASVSPAIHAQPNPNTSVVAPSTASITAASAVPPTASAVKVSSTSALPTSSSSSSLESSGSSSSSITTVPIVSPSSTVDPVIAAPLAATAPMSTASTSSNYIPGRTLPTLQQTPQFSSTQPQPQSHPQPQSQQSAPMPVGSSAASINPTSRSHGDNSALFSLLRYSLLCQPESFESDRQSNYSPRNSFPTHPSFPSQPLLAAETPAFFEKLPIDTLFLSFYYQQGSYQQFLASKKLKQHSWRFHKKYTTWFQRHEEPKKTTDSYEEGTYVYFDYESGWCQRIKSEFKFEYAYLEDDLIPPQV